MHKIFAVAALGIALSSFGLAPAMAQEAERAAAVAACSGPTADAGACNVAVEVFMATVAGLPQEEADAALAALVLELAVSATPSTRALVAEVILIVAAEIADPSISAAASEIATDVALGAPLSAEATDTLASPS